MNRDKRKRVGKERWSASLRTRRRKKEISRVDSDVRSHGKPEKTTSRQEE